MYLSQMKGIFNQFYIQNNSCGFCDYNIMNLMNFKTTLFLLVLVGCVLAYPDSYQYQPFTPDNTFGNQGEFASQSDQYKQFNERQMREAQRIEFIVLAFIKTAYVIAVIIGISMGFFGAYKCYLKRKVSRKIKDQMYLKEMQFASSMGMNVMQLRNDQRFGSTNHY